MDEPRKSGKDYLIGMLGVETQAVKQVAKGLKKSGIKKEEGIRFDNQQWCNGRRTTNEQRKTGKQYLLGMLGEETQVAKQVAKGLKIMEDITKKKAKQFMDNTKRRY